MSGLSGEAILSFIFTEIIWWPRLCRPEVHSPPFQEPHPSAILIKIARIRDVSSCHPRMNSVPVFCRVNKYKDHFSFLRDTKFLQELENDSVDSEIIEQELSALHQVPIR